MATLYAGSDNRIIRYLATKDQEAMFPTPPTGTVSTLTFAKSNNKALWNDLNTSTDAYRLSGTVLTKSGVTQTVTLTDPNSRDGLVQRLDDLQPIIQAATTVSQLRSAVQDLRQIHRDAIRNGQPFPEE